MIFSYLDYRNFLQDFYQYKKGLDPRFSFTVWAEEIGLKSRSFLRLVVVGKRPLTEQTLPQLVKTLELTKKGQIYFMTLVRFNLAKDSETRELYFEELQKYSTKKSTTIYDSYNYLTSHWCPRVHAILSLEDIDKSAEGLAKSVNIPVIKMREVLEILKRVGYADEKNGTWYSKDTIFEVPTELNNLAIQSFHRNSLNMAIKAIDLNPAERQYQSVFFALSAEEYAEVIEEVEKFTNKIMKKYDSTIGKSKKLYQFNSNMIPVSSKLIRRKQEEANVVPEL